MAYCVDVGGIVLGLLETEHLFRIAIPLGRLKKKTINTSIVCGMDIIITPRSLNHQMTCLAGFMVLVVNDRDHLARTQSYALPDVPRS
jgi:hypothetical protein